ncbi:hypothetical protein DOS78_09755 [Staphylococcus felis]|uniref:hypothetical protein n=1 Tax=Staphylococcus felis TaxID=46127 RepID=UPI000CCFE563|nr:hypothetical protein [Staphylococcus felis]AVP35883.1 hypothetical protein C7J90_02530 [Staphylococcus felis]PNZ37266.1 hypothetical protein CD143_02175 [Staphylococcus felis]QQB04138.1 hypothetical protein I6H71_04125 [Staphylococcus felis]REI03296.1 hypothetical protein DOS65_05035 [Staphylococcus felis]REI11959.1 hypothetical protein DOS66_03265 [Staphylococcus felis]
MKMFKLFVGVTVVSFVLFLIASFIANDIAIFQIVSISVLLGVLIAWTFHPIVPFTLRNRMKDHRTR